MLVIAALVVMIAFTGRGDSSQRLRSFHFLAILEVDHDLDSDGDAFDRIEAWGSDARRRWDLSYADPRLQDMGTMILFDGDATWYYEGRTNTYSITTSTQPFAPSLPTLGQIPTGSFESFIANWQDTQWERVGIETVLGRRVEVIEVRSQGRGKTTFWIDPEFDFVLRHVVEGDGVSLRAEVTEVAYNSDLPGELFQFRPPPNALELRPSSGTNSGSNSLGPVGGPGVSPPAGFLNPGYIPEA
ncbi:MAG: hypothetical protein GEU75_06365 [Dehalococcoidia bacterium]|nr:hypothetical protein [Dehalococcoidia bacterium]